MTATCVILAATALLLAGCMTPAKTAETPAQKPTASAIKAPVPPLEGKVWLLAGYETGALFVPLEPGHGSTGKILFGPNNAVSGTTGINTFSGTCKMGREKDGGYVPITISITNKSANPAPNETAAEYEKDIFANLKNVVLLKTEKDSIRLLDGQKRILLKFIYTEID